MSDVAIAAEHLARARVHFGRGEVAKCRAQVQAGLTIAAGTRTEIEVRLLIERSRIGILDGDPVAGVAAGLEASSLARVVGVCTAESELVLGHALAHGGSVASIDRLRLARRMARRAGDIELELEAANVLVTALTIFGMPIQAIRIAELVALRAAAVGKRVAEALALYQVERTRLCAFGDVERGASGLIELCEHAGVSIHRPQLEADIAVALADAGRAQEAWEYFELAAGHADTPWMEGVVAWARSELELTAGRPARALVATDEALAGSLIGYAREEVSCVRRWALYDLGRPECERGRDLGDVFTRTMRHESHAFAALVDGDLGEAQKLFAQAASRWHGIQVRAELRALRAAGLTAAARGHRAEAVALLEDAGAQAIALGFRALGTRLRHDLESVGGRRVVKARRPLILTARECEVLALVGRGLSTAGIAKETGLARTTIETHVRSAMGKLGAKTRVQAVRLAGLGTTSAASEGQLGQDQVALLGLLAAGQSIGQAAVQLAISRRTAARRLGDARQRLGVATTAEAVAVVRLDG
jgi:DNA-binding NarL/FixJ family response regulator